MAHQWSMEVLDVERLLADWRWLCPQKLTLVSRNAFGDLFLRDEGGRIFWLDVAIGRFSRIADSEPQFLALSQNADKLDEWFAESDERAAAERGLIPGPNECIGFSVPLVLKQEDSSETPYVIDIYENVGFLGGLHKQIATLPDGEKVKLVIK